MGLDLAIAFDGDELIVPLNRPAVHAITALRERLPDEVNALFEHGDLGNIKQLPSDKVRRAAESLADAITRGVPGLGIHYYLEDAESSTTATGGQFPINGIDHWITVGQDLCTMQAVYRGPDASITGKGDVVDIRHLDEIATDHGVVRIRCRKKSVALLKSLRLIAEFAERHRGCVFTMSLS